jgi:uncharacterized protein YuzE
MLSKYSVTGDRISFFWTLLSGQVTDNNEMNEEIDIDLNEPEEFSAHGFELNWQAFVSLDEAIIDIVIDARVRDEEKKISLKKSYG